MPPNVCTWTALVYSFLFISVTPVPLQALDVTGKLTFVDAGPDATPVEMLRVEVRSLATGRPFSDQPNRSGEFTLKDVPPGRYKLHLGMPARIRSFAFGSQSVDPLDFELAAQGGNTLAIVLSLAASNVSVQVNGLPPASDAVAILAPSDPMLTLQESCFLNKLSSSETRFRFLAPGKYRLFIVDSSFQSDVAKYAPRLTNFLSSEATLVDTVTGNQANVTANYIPHEVVQNAIREADHSK